MYSEDQILIPNSGIQTIIPESFFASPQVIYLDFDGADASYRNRELDITIDNVHVEASGFDDTAVSDMVYRLNDIFAGDAVFTASRPDDDSAYSTIYIGVTSAFDAYGCFLGLAETVDLGNSIHDDNAFVMTDKFADCSLVVSAVAHEAGHLIGKLEHDGEGWERFGLSTLVLGYMTYYDLDAGDVWGNEDLYQVGLTVSSGATAYDITVHEGSWVEVYSGGLVNGARIVSGYSFDISSGALVYDLYCGPLKSRMDIYGTVSNATVLSGGFVGVGTLSQSGKLCDTVVSSGGVLLFYKGATAAGEMRLCGGDVYVYSSGVYTSNLKVVFDVNEMMPLSIDNGHVYITQSDNSLAQSMALNPMGLLWNMQLLDKPHITIDIGYAKDGMYMLGTGINYADFTDSFFVLDADGNEIPIQINGDGVLGCSLSVVNSVPIAQKSQNGGTNYYTFTGGYFDAPGILMLTVDSPDVDFEFTEIGQPVFYDGKVPEGIKLEGAPIQIPFKFNATVTVNKQIGDGFYEFTTALNGAPNAYLDCEICIEDGVCRYFSMNDDNSCEAVLIGESENTLTYKFTDVEDYVLTDVLPYYDRVELVRKGGNGGTASAGSQSTSGLTIITNELMTSGYADANKKECVGPWENCKFQFTNGDTIKLNIKATPDLQNNTWTDMTADIWNNSVFSGTAKVTLDDHKWTDGKVVYTVNPNGENPNLPKYDITLIQNNNNWVIQSFEVNGQNQQISTYEAQKEWQRWAPEDINACWIATAANMLYRAGYLKDLSAQECYDILTKYYYYKNDRQSKIESIKMVFEDLHLKETTPKNGSGIWTLISTLPKESFYHDIGKEIMTLNNTASLVGGILYTDKNWETTVHFITVFASTLKNSTLTDDEVEFYVTDSDYHVDRQYLERRRGMILNPKTGVIETQWLNEDNRSIEHLYLLIPYMMEKSANGEVIDKRITKEQLLKQFTYDPVNEDKSIFATLWDSVTSLFGETKVNGQITDAVVLDGNLQICPGATADGLVVHSEGTANLMKDSIIEGEITTTGGEINVEAGADVSGAQFNFDLSSMSNGNDTILLNDIGNILEAQIAVTVNNDQALGRYLLAGGAGALSKSVSLNGVRQFDKETDAGFVEGLLGVLTAGEEIRLDGKTFRLSEVDGQLVMDIWRQVCGLTEAAGLISWSESKNASQYIVEISGDGFEHAIAFALDALSLQAVSVPNANFQWRITAGEEYAWTKPADFTIGFHSSPTVLSAASDGVMDVYFAKVTGTWSAGFFARHLGDGDWSGTGQDISLAGKNVVSDLFFGSDDTSILVLTDDAQGDALFLDDIFSLFPEGSEAQARLAGIDELLAGAGNDVIDLTSQDFGYLGAGMTVRGGLGDDVIWANKGNNFLFGDAGNDRLIGASGNEVIVGGSDDDVLHGGGGEDIFVFGGDWGQDSVEQLGNGKITLWFAGNDEGHWNAEERRYSDGVNTVEVVGECANIFVKYGDDGSDQYQNLLAMGAFETFSSERIFEDTNKGILA